MSSVLSSQPAQGQRSDTADFFAQLLQQGLQGTTDIPGIITNNFQMPQYNGALGAGINQSQADMLTLNNSILQKYFGGGYSTTPPNGYSGTSVPSVPVGGFNPNDPRIGFRQNTGNPNLPRQLFDPATGQPVAGGTSSTGDQGLPKVPFPNGLTGGGSTQPAGPSTSGSGNNGLLQALMAMMGGSGANAQAPTGNVVSRNPAGISDAAYANFQAQSGGNPQLLTTLINQAVSSGDPSIYNDPSTGSAGPPTVPTIPGYNGGFSSTYNNAFPGVNPMSFPAGTTIGQLIQNGSITQQQADSYFGKDNATDPATIQDYQKYVSSLPPGSQPPDINTWLQTNGINGTNFSSSFLANDQGSLASALRQLTGGGASASSAQPGNASTSGAPGNTPGFNPNDPTTWYLPQTGAGMASPQGASSYTFSPQFSGLDPNTQLPGLGIPNLPGGTPSIPGSNDILSQLFGTANANPGSFNPQILSMLSAAGVNLGQLGSGSTSAQQGLSSIAGQNPIAGASAPLSQAQSMISSLASNPALASLIGGNNQTSTFNSLASALEAQRQAGLKTDTGNLREQFSANGLRFGTDLAGAIGKAGTDSQTSMNAQLAALIPQLTQQNQTGQISGLNTLASLPGVLGQLGGTAGSLGLGAQSNSTSALTNLIQSMTSAAGSGANSANTGANTLASLFQGNQNNSLQALLASPNALSSLNLLPYNVQGAQQSLAAGDLGLTTTPFNENQVATTANDTNDVRAYQEYLRTNTLFPQLLSFLSGAPAPDFTPSPFSQATNLVTSAGTAAVGAKALSSMK